MENLLLFDTPNLLLKKSDRLLTLFEDIHNHIYANDGLSAQEAFGEITSLLCLKIFDEKKKKGFFYISKEEYDLISHGKESTQFQTRFTKLIKEASSSFKDIIDTNSTSRIKNSTLAYIIKSLQEVNLSESSNDVKGLAFQKFLFSAQRSDRGQFFTPEQVVDLCVRILKPKKSDKILDPACGSAGFLSQALKYIINTHSIKDQNEVRKIVKSNIFGIEISRAVARVAKLRLLLDGDELANITIADTLADIDTISFSKPQMPRGNNLEGYFDIIMTNPPFGSQGKIENRNILRRYDLGHKWHQVKNTFFRQETVLGGQVPDILFIERCLDLLTEGGKLAIVLPNGILENSSLEYIRKYIKNKSNVLAVIKLPQETFIPFGTGVKASILFLQKNEHKNNPNNKIFFGNITKIGYQGNKNGTPTYKRNLKGDILRSTNGDAIIDEDYSPIITAYNSEDTNAKKKDNSNHYFLRTDELETRFDFDYYMPAFRELELWLRDKNALPLGDVVKINKRKPAVFNQKEKYVKYVELADVNVEYSEIVNCTEMPVYSLPSRAAYEIKKGDIITAVAGNSIGTRKHMTALVSEEYDSAICTNGFRILEPKGKIDKCYLLFYLRTEFFLRQVFKFRTGAAIPSISDDDLKQILIYMPSTEEQNAIAQRVNKSFSLRMKSRSLLNNVEDFKLAAIKC